MLSLPHSFIHQRTQLLHPRHKLSLPNKIFYMPFEPNPFLNAQDRVWSTVTQELTQGQKTSHWMWFVFPQLRGLGKSAETEKYVWPELRRPKPIGTMTYWVLVCILCYKFCSTRNKTNPSKFLASPTAGNSAVASPYSH